MELNHTHLRYLIAIYELSQDTYDVSSLCVAQRLHVSKAAVARMLHILCEKRLISKRPYGKIYLTELGYSHAMRYSLSIQHLSALLSQSLRTQLSDDELYSAASALAAALPQRCFPDPAPDTAIS